MLVHYEVISDNFTGSSWAFLCSNDINIANYQPGNGLSIRSQDRVSGLSVITKVLWGEIKGTTEVKLIN